MPFKKGHNKIGGRKKGKQNKFSNLRQYFLDTFVELQKDKKVALKIWAKNNPEKFYEMVSKMLPKEMILQGNEKSPVRFVVEDAKNK